MGNKVLRKIRGVDSPQIELGFAAQNQASSVF
jgi:hypothetical protein